MKRFLIAVAVCAIVLLLGNIFTIGDKLGAIPTVGNYVEGAFYVAIVIAVCYYVIKPFYRIYSAPELPKLSSDEQMSIAEMRKLSRQLARNCYYITDDTQRNEHSRQLSRTVEKYSGNKLELQAIIDNELKLRFKGDSKLKVKGIDRRIIEWAKTVFVTTSISQSSKIDTALVFYLNLKMIEDIIRASGFRPTRNQLLKTYGRILSTAFIAYGVSEVLEDADFEELAGSVVDTSSDAIGEAVSQTFLENIGNWLGSSLIGAVLKSATDGAVNTLLTLRVGFVTRQYLREGRVAVSGSKSRSKTRKLARREAYKHIKDIVVSSRAEIKQ